MAQSDDGGAAGCLVASLFYLVVIGGPTFLFSNFSWSNSLWYSIQYKVGFDDVHTDAKPDDCDFLRAPLGLKGCSYKAHVQVFNADGYQVAGENAPMYGSDVNTGKPIISYDGGKTWNWKWYFEATVPDPKPKSVRVFWVKE